MLTRTNHATDPVFVETEKTMLEKVLQGVTFPFTGKNSVVAGEKKEFLDREEVLYAAIGWGVVGSVVGSKLARRNVESGRAPFLGFIG